MDFAPGTLIVFDRGYTDYNWWLELTGRHVGFVTRLKDSADYGVVEKRAVPDGYDILRDEVIVFTSQQELGPLAKLRRIEVWVEEKQETMAFVTNNLKLAARTIARIYKDRWQISVSRQRHIVQSVAYSSDADHSFQSDGDQDSKACRSLSERSDAGLFSSS